MSLSRRKDWKECLCDDDKQVLSILLDSTKKYRCAYTHAEDLKVAQLWTALIELRKELDKLNELLEKLQEPWKVVIAIGEEEKRKTIEKIVQKIIKPVDETTQKIIKNLVESLMKF